MATQPYWAANPVCQVCGETSVPSSYLCARCRPVMARLETRKDAAGRARPVDKEARRRTMRNQYDARVGAFRCYFTGLPLEVGYGSRRSAEWAHRVPGDESSVVLCCKLVNRMQTDLTEAEFREFVITLARHFQGAPFDESAFPGA